LDALLTATERDTGYRVRVLCQSYPNTLGLDIRDYWDLGKEGQKDDKYVVLVVDQFGGSGNVLNFNAGEGVKFALPCPLNKTEREIFSNHVHVHISSEPECPPGIRTVFIQSCPNREERLN
jgi:hypothetical protein